MRGHRLWGCEYAVVLVIALSWLSGGCAKPEVNHFNAPEVTAWRPDGPREASAQGADHSDVLPEPTAFTTMHGNINNTDHLWIAAAPMFALDWVAETELYVPEGPTYDRQGNLYFSPLYPQENISLVSLDGTTGERRWAISGDGRNAGGGAVLVLRDPQAPGNDIIYHATYEEAMAVKPTGEILWRTPTGLALPPIEAGEPDISHHFGANYHPQTDSIIGVTADGHVFAFDRKSGASRNALFKLPGAIAADSGERPPSWIMKLGDRETDKVFGALPNGTGFFSTLVNVIFGGGAPVTNFYGIDRNSGRIFIAATAPDEEDGQLDGVSEFGALYLLDLVETNGTYHFEILNYRSFLGGTGSTPSISADGKRVIVSDSGNNVIAFDGELNELWRLNLGEQLAASVAISPDNSELYAVTQKNIYKLKDHGTSASVAWVANLDAYRSGAEFNALTPTITANGVVVSVGGGLELADQQLMLSVGMGLLDRATGELRFFAEGREESIAVSSINSDGAIYTANSPVRRAISRALLPKKVPELIGGITRYKPVRLDLLVRDAACAAAHRLENLQGWYADVPDAVAEETAHIRALLSQADAAAEQAVAMGDMTMAEQLVVAEQLAVVDRWLEVSDYRKGAISMLDLCERQ